MNEKEYTREELLQEVAELRRRVTGMEIAEGGFQKALDALRESEELYEKVGQVAFDGVMVNEQGIIKTANVAFASILGCAIDEVIGRTVLDFVPPEHRSFVARQIQKEVEAPYETVALKKDGSRIHVEVRAKNCTYHGAPARVVAVRDITARKNAEDGLRKKTAFVKLLQEIVVASHEGSSPEQVMQYAVDRICAYAEWPVGHVYLVSPGPPEELIPSEIWHLDNPLKFETFRKVTEATRLTRGKGLPGRVLARGKPAWIPDVTKDSNFPRAKQAVDIGVKAAFGFPLLVGSEVAAILEFFSDEVWEPDEAVLELMAHVGTQLGRVIERHRAEEALGESEEKYRKIFENIQDVFYQTDIQGRIIAISPSIERYLGYGRSELIGSNVLRIYAFPKERENLISRLFEQGEVVDYEIRLKNKQGGVMYASLSAHLLRDAAGRPKGIEGSLRDITERKQREVERDRLAYALRSVSECVVITNMEDTILFFNDAFLRTYGYKEHELMGKHIGIIRSPNNPPELVEQILPATLSGGWQGEVFNRRKDGTDFAIHLSTSVIRDEDGKPVALIGVAVDITERRRAEEALRKSEQRYRDLVENSWDLIGIHDLDGRILSVNRAVVRLVGGSSAEDLIGRKMTDLLSPDVRHLFDQYQRKILKDGQASGFMKMRTLSGEERIIEYNNSLRTEGEDQPVVRSLGHDITERRRAERALKKAYEELERKVEERTAALAETNAKLLLEISERERAEEERRQLEAKIQQAQKLESLGVLAGGIAHDFNNLLVGILTSAGIALMKMRPDSPARRSVERIEKAAMRAADLTHQMLAYSGKGKFNVQVLDLSTLVREIAELLRAGISKQAVLQLNFATNLPFIEVDVTQIRQVIMNLITNASEALEDQPGVITLTTGIVNANREYLSETQFGDDLQPGRYVYLEVSDTGHGMDADTRERIFDPFFTTKFTGRGLGLAAVLGIIRGHSGTIEVETEPGRGTTFRVLFPATKKTKEAPAAEPGKMRTRRGSGTILVVDDEEDVRIVSKSILEECGFTVLTANDGPEAVQIFRENSQRIVAVLLDVSMPKMSSEESLREMRRVRGDVPVILSSGYAEYDVSKRFAGSTLAGFIQKPYQPPALIEKVFQVLQN